MKGFRVGFGSIVVVGLVVGIFLLLSAAMSDPHQTQLIWAYAPKIALGAILFWLAVIWLAGGEFVPAIIVALLEGLATYVAVRAIFGDAKFKQYLIEEYPLTATTYDPTTAVVFFMAAAFIAIGIGAGILYGYVDDRKSR